MEHSDSEGLLMARPTLYSEKMGKAICLAISEGASLREICAIDSMPDKSSIFKWLVTHKEFTDQYAHARAVQAEMSTEEMLYIADDVTGDVSGELQIPNGVAVQRAKLRIETRKWIASKLLPKKYGDKQQMEHTGEVQTIVRVISDL
jgi:hypothetical protein